MNPADPSKPLLSVRRLQVHYPEARALPWRRTGPIPAVNDVHFDLLAGETLGIVGERGCGKSTLARTLAGLQEASAGSIRFAGRELIGLDKKQWRELQGDIQLVGPSSLAPFRPRMKLGDAVAEPLRALQPQLSAEERRAQALATMERIGLGGDLATRLPRELNGDQMRLAGLARALIGKPTLLICDELVSALEPSLQASFAGLLADLQRERGFAMIFIERDLVLARSLSKRLLVVYLGKVMEQGRAEDVHTNPRHPYTRALLEAVPPGEPSPAKGKFRKLLNSGDDAPDRAHPPMGCVFHPRCPLAEHACVQSAPTLRRVSGEQYAACHFVAAGS